MEIVCCFDFSSHRSQHILTTSQGMDGTNDGDGSVDGGGGGDDNDEDDTQSFELTFHISRRMFRRYRVNSYELLCIGNE